MRAGRLLPCLANQKWFLWDGYCGDCFANSGTAGRLPEPRERKLCTKDRGNRARVSVEELTDVAEDRQGCSLSLGQKAPRTSLPGGTVGRTRKRVKEQGIPGKVRKIFCVSPICNVCKDKGCARVLVVQLPHNLSPATHLQSF